MKRLLFFLSFLFCSLHATLATGTYTWKSTGVNWDDPNSWSGGPTGTYPSTNGDDVVIAVTNATVRFSSSVAGQTITVKSLNLSNGATIDFGTGNIALAVSPAATGVNTAIGTTSTMGTITGTGSLNITSTVAITATFTKATLNVPLTVSLSTGTLALAATSTYNGTVTATAANLSAVGGTFPQGATLTSAYVSSIQGNSFGTQGQAQSYPTTITDNGSSGNVRLWGGNNTFHGPFTFNNAGTGNIVYVAWNAADTYEGQATFASTGTSTTYVTSTGTSIFGGGLTVDNSAGSGLIGIADGGTVCSVTGDITVKSKAGNTVTLGNGGSMSATGQVITTGMPSGSSLVIGHMTISLSGFTTTAALTLNYCNFPNAVTISAPGLSVVGCTFPQGATLTSPYVSTIQGSSFGTHGQTQSYPTTITDNGSSGGVRLWVGNNTFHGPFTFYNAGTGNIVYVGWNWGDTYEGSATFVGTGTSATFVTSTGTSIFGGGLLLDNSAGSGSIGISSNGGTVCSVTGDITVKSKYGNTVTLGNGGSVSATGQVNTTGLPYGSSLVIGHMAIPQSSFTTAGSLTLNYCNFPTPAAVTASYLALVGCTLPQGGTLTSPYIANLQGNFFGTQGQPQSYLTTVTDNGGGGSRLWYGNNTYYGPLTLNNSGSGTIYMPWNAGETYGGNVIVNNTGANATHLAYYTNCTFGGDLTLNNNGTGSLLTLSYNNGQSTVNGNIVVNGSSSGSLYLGGWASNTSGWVHQNNGNLKSTSFTNGSLYIFRFVQNGPAQPNSLALTGSSGLAVDHGSSLGSEGNTGTATPSVYGAPWLSMTNSSFLGSGNFTSAEVSNVTGCTFGAAARTNAANLAVNILHSGAGTNDTWGGGNTFNAVTGITFTGNAGTARTLDLSWGGTGNIHNADLTLKAINTLATIRTGNSGTSIYNGNVSLSGNVSFNTGTNNSTFSGTADQTIGLVSGATAPTGLTFPNGATVNKTGGKLILGLPMTVTGTLNLTSGNILTTATDLLTVSTLNGGGAASYVCGPLAKATSTALTSFVFPVGKAGIYAPMTLSSSTTSSTLQAEYFPQGWTFAAMYASPLADVSHNEYWTLTDKQGNNPIASAVLPWTSTSNPTLIGSTSLLTLATTTGSSWSPATTTLGSGSNTANGSLSGSIGSIVGNKSLTFGFTKPSLSLVTTSLSYTVSGGGYGVTPVTGSTTPNTLSLYPDPSVGTTLTMLVTSSGQSKTLLVNISAQGQVTGINVNDNGQIVPLPATGNYTLGTASNATTVTFDARLDGNLFSPCVPNPLPENMNYVRSQIIQVAGVTDPSTVDALIVEQMVQSTSYLDGLGRPLEQVVKQYSPQKRDLVQIMEYDANGRTPKDYLPYISDVCNGTYIDVPTVAKGQQQAFYTVNADPLIPKVVDPSLYDGSQNNAYSQVVYDGSPFDRVVEQAAPGDPWKLVVDNTLNSTGTGNTMKQNLRANSVADLVVWWTYDYTTGNASTISSGTFVSGTAAYYPPGSLYVTQTTDEDRHVVAQFTDPMGQLLLKRQVLDAATNLDTYYIYDDLGRLMYIVPPQASSQVNGLSFQITPTGTFAQQWLFAFQYDARDRVTSKKVPGADPVTILYDLLDRPSMTQDGNQAANHHWGFTKYDVLGREVMTGILTDNGTGGSYTTAATFQLQLNGAGTTTTVSETRATGTGAVYGYSNTSFPVVTTGNGFQVLTMNYYDDYDLDADGTADYGYLTSGLTPEPVAVPRTVGLPTVGKVLVMDGSATPNWLSTAAFYDKYYQPVQTQGNNQLYLGYRSSLAVPSSVPELADIGTAVYDWSGKVLATRQVHTPGVAGTVTIDKQYAYDHLGRTLTVTQQNNNDSPVTLYSLGYSELGMPVEKNLHSEDGGATYLQSVDYRYNIRSWLASINNSTLGNDNGATNDDNNDLFGMNLLYEKADANLLNTPKFNGGITAVKWKTNNPLTAKPERGYTYAYDALDRLTGSGYLENSTAWTALNKYSETGVQYDLNGNITGLNRYGGTAGTAIDQLSYTYAGGNQLSKVTDASIDLTHGFLSNGTVQNQTTGQYAYDANGNLTRDDNKGLSGIQYNYLNQVTGMTVGGGTLSYTYDADGNKLSKTGAAGTTHYVDGFVYDGNSLRQFSTEAGRTIPSTAGGFKYQYDLTDHLGNTRISFDKGLNGLVEVVQEDHYYPFGQRHDNGDLTVNPPANKFLYGGNEVQDETGLYDYGFRQYDPVLGRWHAQDAMAVSYHDNSPYHYAHNNPVNHMDYLGLDDEEVDMNFEGFGDLNGGGGGKANANKQKATSGDKDNDKGKENTGGNSLNKGSTYTVRENGKTKTIKGSGAADYGNNKNNNNGGGGTDGGGGIVGGGSDGGTTVNLQRASENEAKSYQGPASGRADYFFDIGDVALTTVPVAKLASFLLLPLRPLAAKGVGGTVDFVAGVQAKSFGKIIGEGTVHVRPTINAIEGGTLLPRNTTGYLNRELHSQLLGKPAGYWQEYHLLEFGGKSPLRILRGGQGEYFLSPDHYQSIIPLNIR